MADTPRGCLARVIVFDQFSRNMFRNTAEAFASDALAVATTDRLLERGMLTDLGLHEQLFALMPLMHAESRERQAQSVKQFEALAARCPDESFVRNVDYAYRTRRIIDRFGRYPHRNTIVGRDSTAEELAFLEEPGLELLAHIGTHPPSRPISNNSGALSFFLGFPDVGPGRTGWTGVPRVGNGGVGERRLT